MAAGKRPFQFGLNRVIVAVFLAALAFGAYRVHPVLPIIYCWGLFAVLMMARYNWSDIAMSVWTVLFLIVSILVLAIAPILFP